MVTIMDSKAFIVSLEKNPLISIKVIPGHFATANAHLSHYLDVGTLKFNALVARNVAQELAIPFLSSTLIDTIVCMENTHVIGAYLAEELLREGTSVINSDGDINIVAPKHDVNGRLIFHDSEIEWITNRRILLLVTTVSSGRTLEKALECLDYYNGKIVGISSLFMSSLENREQQIQTLFTADDIPGYKTFASGECEMCSAGIKLEAIVSSDGYTKI